MRRVKIVRLSGGVRNEIDLPATDAADLGIEPARSTPVTINYILDGLFVGESGRSPQQQCPACGTSQRELVLRGRAGCETCFDAFRDTIDRLLTRRGEVGEHRGRIPKRLMRYRRLFVDRERLLQQLSEAVDAEDFETAADVRDQLSRIPGEADNRDALL